jgi:uncharacterized repeat protein (TIGR03803 family)
MTSDDTVFGTTVQAGTNSMGTAYMVAPGNRAGVWREKIIHDFGAFPGDIISPTLGLVAQPEGLYGADEGGANNTGAVYLLVKGAKGTWTQNILYSFQPFQSGDASFPSGELVRDAKGNFYGVAIGGGANNLGAIYEVSPPTAPGGAWTEAVLFSFDGTNGTLASGPLLLGANGQLYGTTGAGGSDVNQAGTVYELDPPTVNGSLWKHKILHSFTGGADGSSPENGVISDGKGNLLGVAADTVFMLTPPRTAAGTWKESVLHAFTGPDGGSAITPLTLYKQAVYGTTVLGGAFGAGTVFQLTLP